LIPQIQKLDFGKIYFYLYHSISEKEKVNITLRIREYPFIKCNEFEIVWIDCNSNIKKDFIAARRINVGAIYNYSVVYATIDNILTANFSNFFESLSEITSLDNADNKEILLENFVLNTIIDSYREKICYSIPLNEECYDDSLERECLRPCSYELEEESDDDINEGEVELTKEECMKKIESLILYYISSFKEAPPREKLESLISGKIILRESRLSRLVINNNLQIILSDYNETEIKLHPLAKTIYILFMLHPEGIILKNMGDYRSEIENIYNIILPTRDEAQFIKSIDSLVNPIDGSLSQKISCIKRVVCNTILDSSINNKYYIDGERGYKYHIRLDTNMITLPACFR